MLATTLGRLCGLNEAQRRFEPKLDGWRVLVTIEGSVAVKTRSGRDITRSGPGSFNPPET